MYVLHDCHAAIQMEMVQRRCQVGGHMMLQLPVDRQVDTVAGNGATVLEHPDRALTGVDLDLLGSVDAVQILVRGVLDAGSAYLVERREVLLRIESSVGLVAGGV